MYGANPLQPEWKWLLHGWNVRVSETGTDCIPAPDAGNAPVHYIFALRESPTDLEALLREHYPNARERAPIEVPMHHFRARTFDVPRLTA
jgi:hypothetical protein